MQLAERRTSHTTAFPGGAQWRLDNLSSSTWFGGWMSALPLAHPLPTSPGEEDATPKSTMNIAGDRAQAVPNLDNSSINTISGSVPARRLKESSAVARRVVRFRSVESSRPSPEPSNAEQTNSNLHSNGGANGGSGAEAHSARLDLGQSAVFDESMDERLDQYVMLCIELFTFYKRRATPEKEDQIAA